MTNTAGMTNTQLEAAFAEAVEWSNRYFDDGDYRMAEQWHLRANELAAKLVASGALADMGIPAEA